jgi:hypothetical protein
MLVWNPNAAQAYVLYILAGISGLTTAAIKLFTTGLTSSDNHLTIGIRKDFLCLLRKTLNWLSESMIVERFIDNVFLNE